MTQCVAILVPAIGIPQRAAKGVDVTLRLVSEDETGAEHCQHDNPTIGQELMADWLADRFGIDQRAVLQRSPGHLL